MGSLHGGDIIGVNGKIVAKSYPLHLPFSCGLFYGNIAVLFTLTFFFLTEALADVPQFTLRWGDTGKTDFAPGNSGRFFAQRFVLKIFTATELSM